MSSGLSAGVPDSKIAREVTDLARQVCPPFLFNHCARTFWFGAGLAESGWKLDREILYIASMMHDLGVLEPYDQGRRFEVDGARAARDFLEGCSYPAEKIDVVWDAIALHTVRSIAEQKGPEVTLVCFGAAADVAGFRLGDLDPKFVREVVEEFPRLDFPNVWIQTLVEYVKRNPDRVNGTFLEGTGRMVDLFIDNPLDVE